MIKSMLSRFVFMVSVVFVSIFVSGCGSEIERLAIKKDIIKNALLTVILKNINTQDLDILKKMMDQGQESVNLFRVNTFVLNGESCSSLGFSSIASNEIDSDGARVKSYVDNGRYCVITDFINTKASGSQGVILVYK